MVRRSPLLRISLASAATSAASATDILLEDNFDDGDNQGWTSTLGSWSAQGGTNGVEALQNWRGHDLAYTYAGSSTWTDFDIEVDIHFGEGSSAVYVAFRADPLTPLTPDGGNQYLVSVDDDNDQVRLRYTQGTSTFRNLLTRDVTLDDNTTYHVRVRIHRWDARVWMDGELLFDHTFAGSDARYPEGLIAIGYKSNDGVDGAYFDNVVVSTVPCPADLTGDDALDTNDFFVFLGLYSTGDTAADFTGEGVIDTNDFFAFLAAYQVGC